MRVWSEQTICSDTDILGKLYINHFKLVNSNDDSLPETVTLEVLGKN